MNKVISLFIFILLLLSVAGAFSQQAQFNLMVDDDSHNFGTIYALTQDKQGYIWFGSNAKGLTRYNGKEFIEFKNDPENPNSFKGKVVVSINVDSSGMIWISTFGQGLERFDPSTNIFTHYRHNPSDSTSVNSDTLIGMMVDRSGVLWVGSYRGLDRYDKSTGKFTHFNPGVLNKGTGLDATIYELYEDNSGIIWIGSGEPFSNNESYRGGLYRFDRKSDKFTWYGSDPMDPFTLSNSNVTAIFEDSKGNFWVGTKGDGLHQFNRDKGKFTRYPYDPKQPEKLSGPPHDKINTDNFISFITEDQKGRIWIGSLFGGINCYDPLTKKIAHFGKVRDNKRDDLFAKDTLSGLKEFGGLRAFKTKDGLLWVTGMYKNVYTITYGKTTIPYFPNKNKSSVNSFYLEPGGNILWFGTDDGLVQKNLHTQKVKIWSHDPKNKNSLNNNSVVAIRPDEQGKLWIATHHGGLDRFDPQSGIFTHYKHDTSQPGSIGMDSLHCIFFDDDKYLWVGAEHHLTRMDRRTGLFTTFRNKRNDTASVSNASVFSFVKDKNGYIWIGTSDGVNRYDHKTEKFKHYLENNSVKNVFIDKKGVLWVGSTQGLLFYEPDKDRFKFFRIPNFPDGIERVLGIIEDNEQNLWLTTNVSIIKINPARDEAKLYNADYGIQSSSWNWLDNYKAPDGRLFFGGSSGYYMIDPKELNDNRTSPLLNFTNLKIGNKAVLPGEGSVLKQALWNTDKITFPYYQNTFTVEFEAIDYKSSGNINYLYQLENFDKEWRNLGNEHRATFFSISPGSYILHIKAINSEGTMVQKSIGIVITPPWWRTWWAYVIYGILLIFAGWGIYKYQRNYILKAERERTRERELLQAREIEKAYTELKQTQLQLIQSEKMASLGELTAGIAHEIQNPLNFVNNFSEVNTELIDEMQELLKAGNSNDAIAISNDIRENQEKINHHGKRADAIVKGMLQHSRSSTGIKEPTDLNALTDEYLRLAYHGLRAKDKSFNATMKTDFDSSLGLVKIIPQDIGRVVLNLFTNAFYAVAEKARQSTNEYQPTVSVNTKKMNGKVQIVVKDNGFGIPSKVQDKIFQPFFSTKPTGQGTGLGLSLSYDIIKAHGGELTVETKEGEYAAFIITLPV